MVGCKPAEDPELPLEVWVQKTRLEQGLPAHVEDPDVLLRVAELLGLRNSFQAKQVS
jgi:hypothetical protein